MNKYKILFFSVLLFLFACNWGGTPSGIMKQDQMIKVLTEVHIADGSLMSLSPMSDTLYKYGANRYLNIFKKYDTDSAQFRKSLKYYSTLSDKLLAIYQQVSKNIQIKSDSVNKIVAANFKHTADSISKVQAKKQQHIADSLKKIETKKHIADSLKKIKAGKNKSIPGRPVISHRPVIIKHAVSR